MSEARPALGLRATSVLVVLGAAVLGVVALTRPLSEPLYSVLGSAFLHGHLDVSPDRYDVSIYAGRAFYAMGPLPALLMMPLAALLGAGIPSTVIGVPALLACLPALDRILRALEVGAPDRGWWKLAAVAGTPLLGSAVLDSGYFAATVVVVACLAWALALTLQGRLPLLVGVLVGLAAATRADAVFAIVPLVVLAARKPSGRAGVAALMLAGLAPALLLLALYNQARFRNPLESGYALQHLTNATLEAARRTGLFSVRHLPKNLYYLLVAGPLPAGGAQTPVLRWPWIVPSPWGMSMLLVSPWLALAVGARGRRAAIMALGVLLVLLPSLFYYGIGWVQFGYRYGLDALPFAWVLAILGATHFGLRRRRLALLVVVSMLVNLWGDLWLLKIWGNPFTS